MRYKIITESVVKNIIEFLDDIQFTAAEKGDTPRDLELINMCNYIISELLNSEDVSDTPPKPDNLSGKDVDRMIELEFDDMPDEEFNKLIDQFDSFFLNFKNEYHKSNSKKKSKDDKTQLKTFRDDLKNDDNLTANEKFELYYDEYIRDKQKQGAMEFYDMLDNLGLSCFTGD